MSEIILKKQDTDTINLLSLLLWSKAKGVLLLWQKLLLSSFFSKKAKVHIDTKLERRRTLLMPCYFCHFFSNLFCCYSSRAGVLLTINCTFHHIIVQEEEPFTNQLFIIFYSKNTKPFFIETVEIVFYLTALLSVLSMFCAFSELRTAAALHFS